MSGAIRFAARYPAIMPPPADPPGDLTIRAAGSDEVDLVARLRTRCYRTTHAREAEAREQVHDGRADLAGGDVLVAEKAGRAVATVTSLRGEMNARGAVLPTQCIAWVGTTHDARRSGGVASAVMWRSIEQARERGDVLSALMPFRASYYEYFGHGLAERRALWTIPTTILPPVPRGEEPTFRFVDADDEAMVAKLAALRRGQFEHAVIGHGDVIFPQNGPDGFGDWAEGLAAGDFWFADLDPDTSEPRGLLCVTGAGDYGDKRLRVSLSVYHDPAGLLRQLRFLGTLKDQYGKVELAAPADLPLNHLLRESQLPHRGVEHPFATCEIASRNQVRVLDHPKLLDAMPWPDPAARGTAVVAVAESEGHESRFELDVAEGKCRATATRESATFSCADKTWASVVLGQFSAGFAAATGLAESADAASLSLLETLSHGPPPFCRESF